jgi:predicted amidohydrolase YtcJ
VSAPTPPRPSRPRSVRPRSGAVLPTLALLGLGALACAPQEPGTDAAHLLLTNARVYTLDWGEPGPTGTPAADAPWSEAGGWSPDAGAVAIRDGRIIFVGSPEEAEAYRGSDTRVMDLAGATVIPGLVESHSHLLSLGNTLFQVDLVGVQTHEEAIQRVEERAATVPPGSWIVGRGWDEGAWANQYPDRVLLSRRIPDHPVWLRGLHGFAGWANDRALQEAGITRDTEPPVGGEIRRGPDEEPTGLFLNRAVALMDGKVPPLTPDEVDARVAGALETLAASGYVSIHDAGTSAEVMDALQRLAALDALPVRVYAMLNARDEELSRAWIARGPLDDPEALLRVRSVKAYYDAALGSRGARLLADYADLPGHRGISGEGYGFDQALVAELVRAGFQVGVHAIGDAGNREVLDFFQGMADEDPRLMDQRHRVEHAQVVHPDDFPRFGALGLTASMEPPHAVEDKGWAGARLGPARLRGAYAWRTLREAGSHLIFNADLPGSDHDIFYGLHAAVTRRDRGLEPAGGWLPEQRVTPEEAVFAYTRWPARSAFVEDRSGVLREGMWGDLTVMDLDPFQVGSQRPEELLSGRILATIVAGRVIHEAR